MELLGGWHNLEHIMYNMCYVAGIERDVALVNKGGDHLCRKKFSYIPPAWFKPYVNKGVGKVGGQLKEVPYTDKVKMNEFVKQFVDVYKSVYR